MRKPGDDARLHIDITIQPDIAQRFSGLFDAFYGCLQLCASDWPLRDAALELLDLGAPPQTMVTARHLSKRRQMTTTLATAARGFVDICFEEDVVVPFQRPERPVTGSGGDAA